MSQCNDAFDQKLEKKRMKSIGQVDISQKAFLAVLETCEEEGKKQ